MVRAGPAILVIRALLLSASAALAQRRGGGGSGPPPEWWGFRRSASRPGPERDIRQRHDLHAHCIALWFADTL